MFAPRRCTATSAACTFGPPAPVAANRIDSSIDVELVILLSTSAPRVDLLDPNGMSMNKSTDGAQSWHPIARGLPADDFVSALAIGGNGWVYVGTGSSGLFSTETCR